MKKHHLTAEDRENIKSSELTSFQLYNLSSDRKQETDFPTAEPEVLARLKARMIRFHRNVISERPVWEIPEDYA